MAAIQKTGLRWAADNGAFSGFDPIRFVRFLERITGVPRCLFAVCPDRVADAAETLRMFDHWSERVAATGQPVAFVGQDGQEDREAPWDRFAAFFIGGTTEFKLSAAAADLAAEAKRRGKWIHMGRVNSRRRMESAASIGCDSVDGSSASMFGDKYIHKYIRWLRRIEEQPLIF